jgi:hypothetical protein
VHHFRLACPRAARRNNVPREPIAVPHEPGPTMAILVTAVDL